MSIIGLMKYAYHVNRLAVKATVRGAKAALVAYVATALDTAVEELPETVKHLDAAIGE